MICKLFRREDMDCKMTDIIAIISSIIAIGYSIYSIITKSYIRQYNLEKFEHFSLNQKKVCIVFNFIMTLIIGISGVYILLLYLLIFPFIVMKKAKVTKEENTDEARKKFNVFLICMIPVPLIGFIFLLIGLRSFL